MAVPNRPGILGIFLRPSADPEVRVGTMVRDATGVITFEVDDAYVRLGRARPLLSLT
jgi:serine/threonine-protein kinase HipA